ncbi:MAG: hypothetical protein J6D03_09950 [Clostridia bacterium]|nr:hypothetical protein [Clostridia bacterium]
MEDRVIKDMFDLFKQYNKKYYLLKNVIDEFSKIMPDDHITNDLYDRLSELERCGNALLDSNREIVKYHFSKRVVGNTFIRINHNIGSFTTIIDCIKVDNIEDVYDNKNVFNKYKFAPLFNAVGKFISLVVDFNTGEIERYEYNKLNSVYNSGYAFITSNDILEDNVKDWKLLEDNTIFDIIDVMNNNNEDIYEKMKCLKEKLNIN